MWLEIALTGNTQQGLEQATVAHINFRGLGQALAEFFELRLQLRIINTPVIRSR